MNTGLILYDELPVAQTRFNSSGGRGEVGAGWILIGCLFLLLLLF